MRVYVGKVAGGVLEHSFLDGDDDEGGEGAEDGEYCVRLMHEEPDISAKDFSSAKGVFHVPVVGETERNGCQPDLINVWIDQSPDLANSMPTGAHAIHAMIPRMP